MAYCINPRCTERSNPDSAAHCLGCGTPLTINGSYRLQRFLRSPDPSHSTELFEVLDGWNGNKKKVLKSLIKADPILLDLFRREKEVLINFDHPGIPKGEDFFQILVPTTGQELSCIVMEWIEGVDLQRWIEKNSAISQDKALDWLRQITEILAYIHEQKVFHRDIKPSNLMLRPDGTLILIDFGAIKQATHTIVSGHSLTVVSSHGYTAPEQLQGNAVLQSDFFALGRTFVHLLTGQHPSDLLSDLENWSQSIRSPISDELVDLINDLMNKMPAQRPQNAQVLLWRIEAISNASPLPLPTLIKSKVPQRRHRQQKWLLWLVLCLVGLAFAILWWLNIGALSPACDATAGDFLSCGEELLTSVNYRNTNKIDGADAWEAALASKSQTQAATLYAKAAKLFEQSLKTARNDPETRIYFNNARIQTEAPQSLTITVVVPLNGVPGGTESRGLEILRGVAQAQDEAYQQGFKMKILIGDDHNSERFGQKIASELLGKDIPAVIGHYTSDVTKPSIPVYQSGNLVLISPTSTAESLAPQGAQPNSMFFRTVPSNRLEAQALVSFLNKKQQGKAAVFFNPHSEYSNTLAQEFIKGFQAGNQKIKVPTFDLSHPNFNATVAIAQAEKQGETAIAVFPDGYTSTNAFKNSMAIIQANQGKHWIVSGNSLLDLETLRGMTPDIAKRLMIVVPWHLQGAENQDFVKASHDLWGKGADVNWRSATAYDAVMVVVSALKTHPNLDRTMLQKVLADKAFSAKGATENIHFDGSNRKEQFSVLIEATPNPQPSGERYLFTRHRTE
jgi:eukaryotic-like serine/threonine-protein kinase